MKDKREVFYVLEDEKGFRLVEEKDYISEKQKKFEKQFMSDLIEYISSTVPAYDNNSKTDIHNTETITDLAVLLNRYPARSFNANEYAVYLGNNPSSMNNEVEEHDTSISLR